MQGADRGSISLVSFYFIIFLSCSLLQSKGYAIGNAPELAKAHNSHAR